MVGGPSPLTPTVVSPACSTPSTSSPTEKNLFFDGAVSELSKRHAVLRLHFYGDDERCAVSLKARAVLVDSVSRVDEDEKDLDPRVRHECVAEPGKLGSVESRVLRRVKEDFGTEKGFTGLGGFGRR
ncbi:triphosphate tunnel metalloenzyme 3-like [Vigna umbellata]|uniref:triphosphate tunnel metalloenzyme 3-like n=1 Tax=Vigna umbellata TaxID=87088 RepID=UPI001F5F2475|nr:triphosphate tunnel metalloenzyme 3-like [Vigna umbellata]